MIKDEKMVSLLPKSRPALKFTAFLSKTVLRNVSSLTQSYVFHPKKETLEADVQALIWTKVQLVDDCPSSFSEVRSSLHLEHFLPLVAPAILSSRVYERQEVKMKHKNKPRDLTKGSHKNFPISLIFNLYRLVLSHSSHYPQLRDLNLSLEPFISASWPCGEETVSARGRLDMVMNSKRPFHQFYGNDTIQRSTDYSLESLGEPLPFTDLIKYPVKNSYSTGSVDISKKTIYPNAHTLFVLDNGDYIPPPSKGVPEIQLVQKGLTFTFARLYAQAVAKYGEDIIGKDLPSPECAQCVITNGHKFSFIWYQLNSLNTGNLTEGVKNLAFIDRAGLLYTSVEPEGIFKKSLAGLDEEVLRTLISVFIA